MTEETVLVTGFGPFFHHKVNASWEAVKEMVSMGVRHEGKEAKVEAREIPVVYEVVSEEIPMLWDTIKPMMCVHVGVSPYARVRLEKFGRNFCYDKGDIYRRLPIGNLCCQGGPDTLRTVFNVEEVSKAVSAKNPEVEVDVSEDAGRYLCDFIYYTSLHRGKAPVVFVHVPPLDNPYSLTQLAVTLKCIVETLLTHLKEGKVTNDYEIH